MKYLQINLENIRDNLRKFHMLDRNLNKHQKEKRIIPYGFTLSFPHCIKKLILVELKSFTNIFLNRLSLKSLDFNRNFFKSLDFKIQDT